MLGWPEIILIFVVLMLVMGPSKLPEMAKALGNAMREFQKAQTSFETTARQLETQMNTAINTLPPPTQPALVSPSDTSSPLVNSTTPIATPTAGSLALEDEKTVKLTNVAKAMGISTDGKSEEQLRTEIVEALGGQGKDKEVK